MISTISATNSTTPRSRGAGRRRRARASWRRSPTSCCAAESRVRRRGSGSCASCSDRPSAVPTLSACRRRSSSGTVRAGIAECGSVAGVTALARSAPDRRCARTGGCAPAPRRGSASTRRPVGAGGQRRRPLGVGASSMRPSPLVSIAVLGLEVDHAVGDLDSGGGPGSTRCASGRDRLIVQTLRRGAGPRLYIVPPRKAGRRGGR